MDNLAESIIKLSGTNYLIWKSTMEYYLYCKDLLDPIKLEKNEPNRKSEYDWKKLHKKTRKY